MSRLLRDRNRAGSGRVGMVELFFDLVFVFAVTQLSHTLLARAHARQPRARDAAVPGRVVGVDVHGLGDELARPRAGAGPDLPVPADRERLVPVRVDPGVVRRARPGVRGRLRLDAGRPHAVRAVGRTRRAGGLPPPSSASSSGSWCPALFWIVGGFAEPGARLAWWTLALAIELARPVGAVLGARARRRHRSRIGTSTAVTWPSAARCS